MQASEMKMEDFLAGNRTRFVIPVYQRNYDWDQEHCQQLFSDIVKAGQDPKVRAHFIGSIVHVFDDVYAMSSIKELVIIDGQQRLTTLTLMYLALYHLLVELDKIELSEEIYETFLINKFAAEGEKLKLKPTENNSEAFKYLLANNKQQYPEYSRLVDNYNFFKQNIHENNYETIIHGLRKLIFVEIALDRVNDNPQRIFESLNSTGLDLSQADLIRNYLLMGLKSDEQSYLYKNYWSVIESYAKDEIKNQSKVSDFIRDYLTLRNKKIPNKNKVYQEFKNKYPEGDLHIMEEALKDIKRLVFHYNKLVNPQKEQNKQIQKQLEYIHQLGINVAYPFLLQVYDDYTQGVIDQKVFIEVLELVQSFVWRRFIIGLPTNALNKIFMSLYEKVDQKEYLESIEKALLQRVGNQRFPRDKEVLDSLKKKDMYNIQTKNRIYMLERLENHNNNEPVQISGNANITTEHIFPQVPDRSWASTLSTEDYKALKEVYLHTISNLTLSGNNGKLGNKAFREKRDLPEFGYKESRLWLNKYLAKLDEWDVENLESRYDLIKERFLNIWKFPDAQIPVGTESFQEQSIFEAEDPKNKKLDYAIFQDQKLKAENITQLYIEVLRILFEMQPEAFYTNDLFSRISLTKGETAAQELRAPQEIANNYFIETNIDSNGKFERLKQALTVFELEDELSIKYAN